MRKNLLVVDDDKSMRKLLEFLLLPYYNVVCMKNGNEAFNWLKKGEVVDLVITDSEMPVMDGVAFITAMRKSTLFQEIPVLVVSSEKSDVLNKKFSCLEVETFLKKPIDPRTLFWRVEESLGKLVTY